MIDQATLDACNRFDPDIYSDLFKDVYGFRPREDLRGYSAEMLDNMWDNVVEAQDRELHRAERAEKQAVDALWKRSQEVADMLCITRGKALKWLFQAEPTYTYDLNEAIEVFLWTWGITSERHMKAPRNTLRAELKN